MQLDRYPHITLAKHWLSLYFVVAEPVYFIGSGFFWPAPSPVPAFTIFNKLLTTLLTTYKLIYFKDLFSNLPAINVGTKEENSVQIFSFSSKLEPDLLSVPATLLLILHFNLSRRRLCSC